ncbi:MAG: phosphate ABC transporter, permease protein PstA [Bacteroidales bacterium]|nr:MAG: phosphate ABC transporter, permease protein PstA [Bacteroidales bacterium]
METNIKTPFGLRKLKNRLFNGFVYFFAFLTLFPLIMIVFELLKKGYKQFNIDLFTKVAPNSTDALFARLNGETIPGGILNGITGTIFILLIAMVLSIPMGILTGIYVAENRNTLLAKTVSNLSDLLAGIPSIVIGVITYIWIVMPMHSYSAFAGGVSLAIMMLPMIIRSTEESVKMLPTSLKEAGLSLGGSYYSVITKVLLPSAFGGIFTGILLSVSRVIGETAPLLVTALGAYTVNWDIASETSSISLLIWEFYNDPNLVDLVWSSSLLLLIFVFVLNILSKRIAKKWKIE